MAVIFVRRNVIIKQKNIITNDKKDKPIDLLNAKIQQKSYNRRVVKNVGR